MDYLYVCNTFAGYISKINIKTFTKEKEIKLGSEYFEKNGPHGICTYKDRILVANCYSNSLSLIDIDKDKEIDNYFIGMHCNDVTVCDDNAYIICGELNNVIVFDLIKNKVIEEIPCGNFPHSITLDKRNKVLLISNMESDSITLIDCNNKEPIKEFKVGSYPTKAIFTPDFESIIVCESNLGSDFKGNISIISIKYNNFIRRVEAGYSPVDMYYSNGKCYVSNFGDGTVSIIDADNGKQYERVRIGGMPRGIIKNNNFIYVGDNYNNLLIRVNLIEAEKKVIPIGGEPTGMILV